MNQTNTMTMPAYYHHISIILPSYYHDIPQY